MSLAYANAADQEQARILQRIFFYELASGHACLHQPRVRAVEFEIGKLAMLIALRDSRRCQQCNRASFQPTVAAYYARVRARLPSTSTTQRANFSSNLHDRSLLY